MGLFGEPNYVKPNSPRTSSQTSLPSPITLGPIVHEPNYPALRHFDSAPVPASPPSPSPRRATARRRRPHRRRRRPHPSMASPPRSRASRRARRERDPCPCADVVFRSLLTDEAVQVCSDSRGHLASGRDPASPPLLQTQYEHLPSLLCFSSQGHMFSLWRLVKGSGFRFNHFFFVAIVLPEGETRSRRRLIISTI